MGSGKLIIGVSQVADGNMSATWGPEEEVRENRKRFLAKVGLRYEDSIRTTLVHGTDVVWVSAKDKLVEVEADAFVTRESNLVLTVIAADCIPMIVYDKSTYDTVAVVHVSRKNVEIIRKLIKRLRDEAIKTEDLKVWIGPCIKKESYVLENRDQIGPEWDEYLAKQSDGWYLDLVGRAIQELRMLGIKMDKIEISPIDVFRDKDYFSHKRSLVTGEPEGRFMMAVAKID